MHKTMQERKESMATGKAESRLPDVGLYQARAADEDGNVTIDVYAKRTGIVLGF